MNEAVIEAQALYLIEDRMRTAHRTQSARARRQHRRPRALSWL
jgi:hypothetical protein